MRALVIGVISTAAVICATGIAEARDGCGPGRYYNGYRCAPVGGGGYGYERGPRYGYGPGGGGGGNRYIGNGMIQNWRGEIGCTRPGFTVQDGVCKPYRGY